MAEQRLIEEDVLLKKLERMWDCTDIFFEPKELLCDPLGDCKGCKWKEILDFVKRIVKSSKTVDAKPVVHGHWIHCNGTTEMWHCSECGATIMYNENPRTNHQYHKTKQKVHECNKYCRNCGSRMDELFGKTEQLEGR